MKPQSKISSVCLAIQWLAYLSSVKAGTTEIRASDGAPFPTILSSPPSYRDSPSLLKTRTNAGNEYPSRRSLRSNGSITVPIFQGYGAHYVEMNVGTPPQPQTFLLDTGSATIGIPCKGCIDCGGKRSHIDFDQSVSETFSTVGCGDCLLGHCVATDESATAGKCVVETNYLGGCSWRGDEVMDYVSPSFGKHTGNKITASDSFGANAEKKAKGSITILDGEEIIMASSTTPSHNMNHFTFKLKYSCMTTASGQFKTQLSNGIAGMGLSEMSLWRQMYKHNALPSKKFSMCIAKSIFPGDVAGALTLGGAEKRLNKSEMNYMNLHNEDGMYGVKIRKLFVHKHGGETIGDMDLENISSFVPVKTSDAILNNGGVILDSGTTNTYLSGQIRDAIDNAWLEVTGKPFPSDPLKLSPEELRTWPTIVFQMQGKEDLDNDGSRSISGDTFLKDGFVNDVLVAFPPSHYMQLNTRTDKFEPRFILGDEYGNIIGENFMRGHNVLFDVDNWRVGFAESNCDYSLLRTGHPSETMDPYLSSKDMDSFIRQRLCTNNPWICLTLAVVDFLSALLFFIVVYMLVQSYWETAKQIRDKSTENLSWADTAKLLEKNSFDCDRECDDILRL